MEKSGHEFALYLPESFERKKGFGKPKPFFKTIDATGFEPATSASLTQRSTKLSHASKAFLLKQLTNNITNKNKMQLLF